MGNCLVTKLKESVNNPNLPKLGELKFWLIKENASVKSLYLLNSDHEDIEVTCDSNGLFDNGTRKATIVGGSGYVTLSSITGETVITINPWYNLIKVAASTVPKTGGSINSMPLQESVLGKLTDLQTLDCRYLDSVESLQNCTELTTATLVSLQKRDGTNITENIVGFAPLLKLATLNIYKSRMTGSIEGLADAQKASRNNGDTLAIRCNGIITYNDTAVTDNTIKTITFDGQGGYTVI